MHSHLVLVICAAICSVPAASPLVRAAIRAPVPPVRSRPAAVVWEGVWRLEPGWTLTLAPGGGYEARGDWGDLYLGHWRAREGGTVEVWEWPATETIWEARRYLLRRGNGRVMEIAREREAGRRDRQKSACVTLEGRCGSIGWIGRRPEASFRKMLLQRHFHFRGDEAAVSLSKCIQSITHARIEPNVKRLASSPFGSITGWRVLSFGHEAHGNSSCSSVSICESDATHYTARFYVNTRKNLRNRGKMRLPRVDVESILRYDAFTVNRSTPQDSESAMCKPTATKTRTVCWMYHDAKGLIEAGCWAPLAITIDGVTTGYWVERIDGGWRFRKETPDGSEPQEIYTIACFTRGDVRTWECDCRDHQYRGWRRPCKHVAALAAALGRIGLI